MNRTIYVLIFLSVSMLGFGQTTSPMKKIGQGVFTPLYGLKDTKVTVKAFYLDQFPVTNQQYLDFVKKYPKWQKSKVIRLFADDNYLSKWKNDFTLADKMKLQSPVTSISWFAAKAYCECQGKRLPTIDEWEYVGMANETLQNAQKDSLFNQRIIESYETPKTYAKLVGSTFKNYWGVYDLHGLVWEWVSDFNSVLISGESRKDVDTDRNLFCAGGAVNATALMDYAAFMRYAFRGSIKANYSIRNLGFRCAKDSD